eukprot:gnl/MRDRNA2_/MRDRNA2_66444_c0_seq2.p1 gnl/MRDRNA2_/MRDRNA2_66444_c0~~gnl/MRDRNA2_/MRDRNA2_66444_c0_seq2.p1  ORF type:complete len:159 (+),score=15.60 gnl/MRDRNA2_/MRDRNA2_66444_c0_seq2:71-547(+)
MPPKLLPFCHQADIVRGNQRDDFYRNDLRNQAFTSVEQIFGHHRAMRWQGKILFLTDVVYLGLTAGLCNRTLGEEYCDYIAITTDLQKPTLRRRFLAVVLHVGGSVALRRLAVRGYESTPSVRSTLASALQQFLRIHLAWFYFFGGFRHFAERVCGIR